MVVHLARAALHVSDLAPDATPAEQPFVDVPLLKLTSEAARSGWPALQLTIPSVAIASAPAYLGTLSQTLRWGLAEVDAMLGAGMPATSRPRQAAAAGSPRQAQAQVQLQASLGSLTLQTLAGQPEQALRLTVSHVQLTSQPAAGEGTAQPSSWQRRVSIRQVALYSRAAQQQAGLHPAGAELRPSAMQTSPFSAASDEPRGKLISLPRASTAPVHALQQLGRCAPPCSALWRSACMPQLLTPASS